MQKQEAWSRFWRGGSLTSFGDRFSKGYEGVLRDLWNDFFGSLSDGAVVIDLGAGNGALEEIAYDFCAKTGRQMTLHAFDLAPSLPASFKGDEQHASCRIVWHTATRNEATGLDDASVDAVTSSYAYEYGDDALTAREIARVLRPGGRCRFLMHFAGSKIIEGSRNELEVLDAELEKGGFLDTVAGYLREFGDIRKPAQFEKMKKSGRAEPFRQKMNDAHQRALRLVKTEHSAELVRQIMQWMGQLVAPPAFFLPKEELLERLKEIRRELAANRVRLVDMQNAAVDEERMERIRQYFVSRAMSFDAELLLVAEAPAPIGWKVDVRRT